MLYISKGTVKPGSTDKAVTVNLRGSEYSLSGDHAALWLAGQFGPRECFLQTAALDELINIGLAEATDESGVLGRYRLLTYCILVPARLKTLHHHLSKHERPIWQWISKAGLRLTVAELICLAQNRIEPLPKYLGETNRQNLVEAIYSAETIGDNILENLMERSAMRDEIVDTVFFLLCKQRIILI